MINIKCYYKNWMTNVCSHKCHLYKTCYSIWKEYLKTKPINMSKEESINLLIKSNDKYREQFIKLKTQKENETILFHEL